MPESRWVAPIFYSATIALFLVFVALIHFFAAPKLLVVPAYLLAPIGGFSATNFYLKRKPDARYLTTNKVDGTGYVWTPLDVLAPYLIFGVITLVMFMLRRRGG